MDQLSIDYIDIEKSELFSAEWYLTQYPDVAKAGVNPIQHYLSFGAFEGRDPGPKFSTIDYLERYPDVAKANVNPLLHYLRHGKAEGRVAAFSGKLQVTERAYRNLADYLKYSLLNPIVKAPFVEEDKRCFAVMDNVARWLCQKLNDCKHPPLVSIIMPMRDRAHVVGEAIDSVLAQTYQNLELIVIDDSSLDESVDIVRSFSDQRIHLIGSMQWIGVSAARNRGLKAAKGDIIAYLDSDNTWFPDYLATMLGAFQAIPDADALYCGQYLYQNHDSKPFAVRFGCYNPTLLQNRNYIDLNCFLHRRSVIKTIGGGFCEHMKRLVDWELILRISKFGKIYSIPVIKSNYYKNKVDNTITTTEQIGPARDDLMTRTEYSYKNMRPGTYRVRRKVAVVIPSYESLTSLRSCIDSLAEHFSNQLVQTIIVDNASGIKVASFLRGLAGVNIKVVYNDYNYGFSYAVNQGVALADPDSDILLLNNDAALAPGALAALQEIAYTCNKIAISAPQQVLAEGEKTVNAHVPYADNNLPCDVTLSSHHSNVESLPLFHDGSLVELNFATFFCVYIKRHVWELCGGLDAQNGRHYRSDRIMCDYIRLVLGMRIVYTPESVVFHRNQAATIELKSKKESSPDYKTIFEENRWPESIRSMLGYKKPVWEL
jgi:glycosyltransferase involved in cell wall biosynthesis